MRTHARSICVGSIAAFVAATVAISLPARSAIVYWDIDGINAGAGGATPSGTWDGTNAFWNSVADGTGSTAIWQAGDTAIFSAGTNATGSYAITVSGTQAIGGLTVEDGIATFSGGTLNLTSASVFSVANNARATIGSTISGGFGISKTGNGSLRLTGANTFTGPVSVTNGVLQVNSAAALGTDPGVITVSGNTTKGLSSGQLFLNGTMTNGITLARDLALTGGGPQGDGVALLNSGNNVLSGDITITGTTRLASVGGTTTLNGSLNTGSGVTTQIGGSGNWVLNGKLTAPSAASTLLEKIGTGTLVLNPADGSSVGSEIRITQGAVRISSGTGYPTLATNAGTLEIRTNDGDSFANTNLILRNANSTNAIFLDRAVGSAASVINETVAFNLLTIATASTTAQGFSSRNGFGLTANGAATTNNITFATGNNIALTNALTGKLTLNGNPTITDSSARTYTFQGGGETEITGFFNNTSAAAHTVVKTGTGKLTLSGTTAGTGNGTTTISGGTLEVASFNTLLNGTLNIGNATTTSGTLTYIGAGETFSRALALNSTTANAYLNASGSGALIVNGTITSLTGGAKTFVLGGTSTADNEIASSIPDGSAATSLQKAGPGTWVLSAANGYTGSTSISGGTLKLKDSISGGVSRNLVGEGTNNTVNFSVDTFTQAAGGTLEYLGDAGASTETLGALTPTAGAGTVKVTPAAGQTAALTFTSLGTFGAGASVNFVPAAGGSISIGGTGGFFNARAYFNGSDFAFSSAGSLRALVYDADPAAVNATTALVADSHNRVSSDITSSGDSTILSLKLDGSVNVSMPSSTLTVNSGGILQAGGTSVITAGSLASGGVNDVAVRVNGSTDSLTIAAPITGPGLQKNGAGTLILSSANGYTSATHISEGTLRLSGTGTLGNAANALNIRQAGTLDLNGVSVTTGVVNGAGTITSSSAGGVLTSNASTAGVFTGTVTGSLGLTKTGSATLSLTGNNSYTGVTTINQGTLAVTSLANLGDNSAIGRGNAADNAGSLVFGGGTLLYTGSSTAIFQNTQTPSVSIDRLFTLAGNGTIQSSGTFGNNVLTAGAANNAALIFNNTGDIVFSGTGTRTLTLGGTSTSDNEMKIHLIDNGASALTLIKADAGLWILNPSSANTYTGGTTISGGALQAVQGVGLSNANLTLGGGVLQTSGSFTRSIGTGVGAVQWASSGGGGFAASTSKLTVSLGNGAAVTWQNSGSTGIVGSLLLNSTSALSEVEVTNNINLNGATRTVQVEDNVNTGTDLAILSGVISGTGNLTKAGAGTLYLTGANTYAGNTSITGGTLAVTSIGGTGVASSSLGVAGGALSIGSGTTSGTLIYLGAGEVSDRQINLPSSTGGVVIEANGSGPLVLTNVTNTATAAGPKTLTLRGYNTDANEIRGNLADVVVTTPTAFTNAIAVSKTEGSTWILSGNNSYSGGTTLSSGTLGAGSNTAFGTGTVTLSSGTLFAAGADRTLSNVVTFGGNVTNAVMGDYSLTLAGNINFGSTSGSSTINNYIVSGKELVLGSLGGTITNGDASTSRTLTIAGTGNTRINGTLTNSANGAAALTVTSTGTTTLAGNNAYGGATTMSAAAGTLVLTGTHTGAGAFTLTNGTVQLNNAGANGGLPSGLLTLTAGTLQALNASRTVGNAVTLTAVTIAGTQSLTFNGKITGASGNNRALTNNLTSGTLTIGNLDITADATTARTFTLAGTGNTNITGVIANGGSGNSNFSVTSAGTTTLSGANTYSGLTTLNNTLGTLKLINGTAITSALTVNAGTLVIDPTLTANPSVATLIMGGGAAGSSAVIDIGSGKTLNLTGTTSAVTFSSSNSNLTGTIGGAGTLNLGTGALTFNIGNSTNADIDLQLTPGTLTGSGTLIKIGAGALYLNPTTNNFTGTYQIDAGALLGIGGTGHLLLNGGVFEGTGSFTRTLAATAGTNTVQWAAGVAGGFSAAGGDLTVDLAPSGPLVWGTTAGFVNGAGSVILNSTTSTGVLDWQDNIDLNDTATTPTRLITVNDNTTQTTDKAVLSGVLSASGSGGAILNKAGTGILELTNANTFVGGVTVTAGTLRFTNLNNLGAAGNNITLAGGTLEYNGVNPATITGTFSTTGTSTFANNSAGLITVSNPATFGASLTLGGTGAGGFSFTGDVVNSGGDRIVTVTNPSGATFKNIFLSEGPTTSRTMIFSVGAGVNVTLDGVVANTLTGTTPSSALRKDGLGTMILNAANTFTNELRINQGTVEMNVSPATAQTSTNTVVFNNANVLGATSKLVLGAGVVYPIMGLAYVGNSTNAQSTATITGDGKLSLNATRTFDVRPSTDSTGKLVIETEITESVALSGITKTRNGLLVLSGNNTYTGPTSVSEGTLQLDYTAKTGSKISTTGGLTVGGGTLDLKGHATIPVTQTVSGTTIAQGASTIRVDANGGAGITLNLNGLTSSAAGRSVDFITSGPGAVIQASFGLTNDILGGWATYNNRSFATISGGQIVAATTAVKNDLSTWGLLENISNSGAFTGTMADLPRISSLAFAKTGTVAVSNTLNLDSGGVLVASDAGASDSFLSGGTLVSTTTNALFFQQHNTAGSLTVTSAIRGALSITKSGQGKLIIDSDSNDTTGAVFINRGTLVARGGNALSDTSLITIDPIIGATLQLEADEWVGTIAGGGPDGGTIDIGDHTLTLNNGATFSGYLVGSGTIIKNGATNLQYNTVSNPGFTGMIQLNQGLLVLASNGIANLPNAAGLIVNPTGAVLFDNNGSSTSANRLLDTATIDAYGASGATATALYRGIGVRTDQNSTRGETVGTVNFNAGSNYGGAESLVTGTSNTSSIGELVAANFTRGNHATLSVRGTNLGTASAITKGRYRINNASGTAEANFIAGNIIGGGGAAGSPNISIVPWVIGQDLGTAIFSTTNIERGNSLVTYVAGVGFRPLNFSSEYSTYAAAGATDNVRATGSTDFTGLTGKTINALVINNESTAAPITAGGSGNLVVTSGAFLFTAVDGSSLGVEVTTPQGITLNGFDSITVGPALASGVGNEFVFHVANNSAAGVTVASNLVDSTAGNTAFTKSGLGTLTLTGNNTYTGATTLNEGALVINDWKAIGGATGAADLVMAGGTLRLATGFTGDFKRTSAIKLAQGGGIIDTNGASVAIESGIANVDTMSGGLTKAGAGVLTLKGTATYTGVTSVTGGTLQMAKNQAIGTGDLSVNGGTLDVQNFNANVGKVSLLTNGAITGIGTLTSNGTIFDLQQGTVSAILAGSSTLIKNSGSTVTLSGLNTYTGATEIRGGTLSVDSIASLGLASALGAPATAEAGAIRMGLGATAATLTYTGDGDTSNRRIDLVGTTAATTITNNGTGALNLSGGISNAGSGIKTLTLSGTSADLNTISGVIQEGGNGAVSVTKSGAGTWVLSGANTYTGATTINGGTLVVANDQALGLGTVLNLTAGTLQGDGSGARTLSQSVVLNNTAAFALGGTDKFTFNGSLTNSGGNRILNVGPGGLDLNGSVYLSEASATGRTLTIGGTGDVKISGPIANVSGGAGTAGNFTYAGTGTITLTGANTYTGTTTVSGGGTMQLDGAGVIPAGGAVTVSAGTLKFLPGAATPSIGLLTLGGGAAGSSSTFDLVTSRTFVLTGVAYSATNNNLGATITGAAGSVLDLGGTSRTFNVGDSTNAEFDVTLGANVTLQNGSIVKSGAGTLYIAGTNNTTGTQEIQGGAIFGNITSNNLLLNGGAYETSGTFSRTLGTGTNQVQWGPAGGGFSARGGDLTIDLGTVPDPLVWGGTTNFVPAGGALVFGSGSSDSKVTFGYNINLNSTTNIAERTIQVNDNPASANDRTVITGVLSNSGAATGIIKSGTGSLELTQVNTYTGATSIDGGTLKLSSSQTLAGALKIGSTNANTTPGTLDLSSASLTVPSFVVQTNSTGMNNLILGAGQTLTVNGNVLIGNDAAARTNTNFTASGGGILKVTGTAFRVGGYTGGTGGLGNAASADFSGLSSMTVDIGTGTFGVSNTSSGNTTGVFSLVRLAPETKITAGNLNVGDGGQNASTTQVNQLYLGSSSNTINANIINIGTGSRDLGLIAFGSATGTVKIRNTAGLTGGAALNMGVPISATTTGVSGEAGNTFDVSGHEADIVFTTVRIGLQNARQSQLDNTFSWDKGSLTMTSLEASLRDTVSTVIGTPRVTNTIVNLGSAGSTLADTATITNGIITFASSKLGDTSTNATLNVAGGTVNIGQTGGVSIKLAESTTAAAGGRTASSATAEVNFTGGVATLAGSINKVGGAGNSLATVRLDGGTLDMSGNSIKVDSFEASSGTLRNLNGLFGSTGAAMPLSKIGTGTLTFEGTMNYAGPTQVSAGALVVKGSLTGTSSVQVDDSASLSGTGTIQSAVTVKSGGTLSPGLDSGTLIATLATGALSLESNSLLKLDIDSSTLTSDMLNISSSFSLAGTNDVRLSITDLGNAVLTEFSSALVLAHYATGTGVGGLFSVNGLQMSDYDANAFDPATTSYFTIGSNHYMVDYNYSVGGDDRYIALIVVPEPGALTALVAGGSLLLGLSRRRRPAR